MTLLIPGGKYVPDPLLVIAVSTVPPDPSGSEKIFEREFVIDHSKSTLPPFGIDHPGVATRLHVGGFWILDGLFQRIILELYAAIVVGKVIGDPSIATCDPALHTIFVELQLRLMAVDPVLTKSLVSVGLTSAL